MPRPKPTERRRCLKACEGCKRRKEKCDGAAPCSPCKKRKIETSCTYITIPSSYPAPASQKGPVRSNDSRFDVASPHEFPVEAWRSTSREEEDRLDESVSTVATSAPKHSRLVEDAMGGHGMDWTLDLLFCLPSLMGLRKSSSEIPLRLHSCTISDKSSLRQWAHVVSLPITNRIRSLRRTHQITMTAILTGHKTLVPWKPSSWFCDFESL